MQPEEISIREMVEIGSLYIPHSNEHGTSSIATRVSISMHPPLAQFLSVVPPLYEGDLFCQ
jgi:hypothetical protein